MNTPLRLGLGLAIMTAAAAAQIPSPIPAPPTTPPVAKALPLPEEPSGPADSSAVPKALPVDGPTMNTAPGQVPKAVPIEEPTPAAKPGSTQPGDDIFDYASLAFERSEWEIAREALAKYLQSFPQGRHGALALMRIGECYRNLNQEKVAEAYFEEVVTRYPKSDSAAGAAYRLGALRFNARQYESSVKYFEFCEQFSTQAEVRLAAAYNLALSLQMMGENSKRADVLGRVIAVKQNNPYRDPALLALGTLKLALREREAAEALLKEVMQDSKDAAIQSEATSKLGALLTEMGRHEEALPLLNRSLTDLQAPMPSRQLAALGLMQALSALNRFEELGKRQEELASLLPPGDTRFRLGLAQAHGLRQSKEYVAAADKYAQLETAAPSDVAFEAGYWSLYCQYLAQAKDLGARADAFIVKYAAQQAQHEWINFARLIKADDLFSAQQWPMAAASFSEVNLETLPPALQASARFNKAWALAEASKHKEAIGAFDDFLTKVSTHELRPRALARRGLCHRQSRDFAKAVSDFREVFEKHPNSDSAEFSLLQIAMIATEQRDLRATAAAFEQFLNKYPNSRAAALAWYELGRTAYSLQDWKRAADHLRKAAKASPQEYFDLASQMLIQIEFAQQNIDGLGQTIGDYRKANPKASIPSNVLIWLGLKHFSEARFPEAAKYLEMASTPEAPDGTDPRVWNYLSQAQLHIGSAKEAVQSVEHFLRVTPDGPAKARGLLTKGEALVALARLDEADAVAQQGLVFAKDGRPQAMMLVLEGDILRARALQHLASNRAAEAKDAFTQSAAKYMVPAQFFEDDELTPEALRKLVEVLSKAGQQEKAEGFEKMLQTRLDKPKAAPQPPQK